MTGSLYNRVLVDKTAIFITFLMPWRQVVWLSLGFMIFILWVKVRVKVRVSIIIA